MEEELLKPYNLKVAHFSEQGTRPKNEDRLFYSSFGANHHLLIVADGMGGYDDGDLAAEIAIKTISDIVTNIEGNIIESIELAFFKAHTTINKKLLNAGATVGGIVFWEENIYAFWTGDVKIIISNGSDTFVSRDHTLFNTLRDAQITIKPEEVRRLKSTVMRSVGGKANSYSPEIVTFKRNRKCTGLICTDGMLQFHDGENLIEMVGANNIFRGNFGNEYKDAFDNVTILGFTVDQ